MADSPLAAAAKTKQPKQKPDPSEKPNLGLAGQPGDSTESITVSTSALSEQTSMVPKVGDKFAGPLMINLGISDLVEFTGGYVPSRPELDLTPACREAIKRLALTLEQRQERLSDGTEIRGSVPKTIVWLCERFAEAV